MKLRYKILGAIVVLLAAGVVTLVLALIHTAPCGAAPPLPAGAVVMKGITRRCYGPPDVVLKYEDVAKPAPADDEVLVRVRAASVNPLDWHYVEGTPYLVRIDGGFGKPENPRLGVDFAGTVEAVGKSVRRLKPGDEVFGGRFGAFASFRMPAKSACASDPRKTIRQRRSYGQRSMKFSAKCISDSGRSIYDWRHSQQRISCPTSCCATFG